MLPRIDFGQLSAFGFEFPLVLHLYSFALTTGFLLALAVAAVRARRSGLDAGLVMKAGLYIAVSAFLGAKLLLVILHWEHLSHAPMALMSAGGVFYGGFVAAAVTSVWFFRKNGASVWSMMDLFAPSVALGHAIGRLGCFSAGCCYGRPTDAVWAVTFTDASARKFTGVPLGVPLHPTQLYDSLAELAIFGLLLYLAPRKRFDGQVFWSYVVLYAGARFFIEYFRGDWHRGVFFGGAISTSQLVATGLFAMACFALATHRRFRLDQQEEAV